MTKKSSQNIADIYSRVEEITNAELTEGFEADADLDMTCLAIISAAVVFAVIGAIYGALWAMS